MIDLLPPFPDPVVLTDATLPAVLLRGIPGQPVTGAMADGLVRTEIGLAGGRVHRASDMGAAPRISAEGWTLLPRLVDGHAHLDKAYTIAETGLGDGSLNGAMGAVYARLPGWDHAHYSARMHRAADAALRAGTGALRTHIDCATLPSATPAWQAAQDVRASHAGRLTLQLCALCALSRADEPAFEQRCREVADAEGVLGAFIARDGATPALLDRFLTIAGAHGLDVDFHVDEHLGSVAANVSERGASSTEALARAVLRTGYRGRVVAGHACALADLAHADLDRACDTIGEAGLTIAALPRTNLFLQDRTQGRTPRRRGITVAQELAARGIPVMLASDNVNDAFYPFGDFDLLGLLRDAAVAMHLDTALGRWIGALTDVPARALGLEGVGTIAPGGVADMILVPAMEWSGILNSAPRDRQVLVGGVGLAPARPTAPAQKESVAP